MTNVGALRHRVELQYASGTSDEGGGTQETWLPKATVWARIDPINGREAIIAGRISSTVTHTITIRYRTGITSEDRFRLEHPDGMRTFDISAIVNVNERNRWLRCFCEERNL